ncbi:uncharacterized protein LOC124707652 [Lolium rigidum]|uniref:uncharacterized protein LOC124707652 n=1 Tax=Lolium rigidum TaxID=89674 RepID=UPI001F5DBA5C|nr:uncharacterized protein LOC124707652 [Lolium rigidum]
MQAGMDETDLDGALTGFVVVVPMEPGKAECGNEACTEAIATTQAKIPKSFSEDSEDPQQERKGNQLNMEGSLIFFLHMWAFCSMYTCENISALRHDDCKGPQQAVSAGDHGALPLYCGTREEACVLPPVQTTSNKITPGVKDFIYALVAPVGDGEGTLATPTSGLSPPPL